jgi:hypothetical protein
VNIIEEERIRENKREKENQNKGTFKVRKSDLWNDSGRFVSMKIQTNKAKQTNIN